MALAALTLDLDDTLWPVWPAIARAEAGLHTWLGQHAPATATLHDTAALRRLRQAIEAEQPERAMDLSGLRRDSIRRALQAAGDDPALAEPAFAHFLALRQQVELFDDVLPALRRLKTRFRLVALSNGNADVLAMPALAGLFDAAFSAQGLGVGKPHPAAFEAACAAVGCAPHQVLHVGDDGHTDVDGALAAGLQAAWLLRPTLPPPRAPQQAPHWTGPDLQQLADHLVPV